MSSYAGMMTIMMINQDSDIISAIDYIIIVFIILLLHYSGFFALL